MCENAEPVGLMSPSDKAIVIVSSVCGNTYLLAQGFVDELKKKESDVTFRRVEHTDFDELARDFPVASEYYQQIMDIPVVAPDDLLEQDLVILGTPTYFGNMSGEMKRFLDRTSIFYRDGNLAGKNFMAFTSSGTSEGGAHLCLQTLITYSMQIGMIPIPIPPHLCITHDLHAFGLTHYSGDMGDKRPPQKTFDAIPLWLDWVFSLR